jgi:hypothetical protein
MANPLYYPVFRAFDANGEPLAGGKVYTYEAGTTTPKASYTNSTMSVENPNPVILDAEGSAQIWVDGSYKINLLDANDVQQNDFPVDNFINEAGEVGPAGTFQMATAGGTADAITADYTPDVTLSNLTTVGVVFGAANATTTPTFSPDGLTPRTIVKNGGQALVAGDIAGAGHVGILEYNSANTRWELLNPAGANFVTLTGAQTLTNKTINASQLVDASIAAAKLASDSVTTAKILNSNVTTAKIADANVTPAKLSGAQSGSAPIYGVRAWVSFDGTGTPAIRGSGNVTSITDHGTGEYSINFTTAVPANYAFTIAAGNTSADSANILRQVVTRSTTVLRIVVGNTAGAADLPDINVIVIA